MAKPQATRLMMPVAENSAVARLEQIGERGWWFTRWGSARVMAGVTDRHVDRFALLRRLPSSVASVEAEQAHGSSIAIIEHPPEPSAPIAGCDGLLTSSAELALLIRTADCLPIFFAEPSRGVIGIAHVGWRGLAALLPLRMLAAFRGVYHIRAEALRVAIGPAIRDCCYEVGSEFTLHFGPFVRQRGARRTCDLVGAAVHQLRQGGVRPERIADCQQCTACDTQRWYSLRREGPATGRLTALIMLRA